MLGMCPTLYTAWGWPKNPPDSCVIESISTYPWAERQALEMRLKGSKHALNFFRVALPHHYLHIGSSTGNILQTVENILLFPKVARFTESQVDEVLECGCSKSNAHPRG